MKKILLGIGLSLALIACPNPAPNPTLGITSVTLTAVNSNLSPAATTAVNAVVVGTGAFSSDLTWSITSGGGVLSATTGTSVTFTAPNATAATVIRATSVQDTSKFGEATVNTTAPASSITGIALSSTRLALKEPQKATLSATVSGTGAFNNALTWAIESGGVGTLSSNSGASVEYTPSSSASGRVVRVTATSVQDPTQKSTIYLGIYPNKQSIAANNVHSLALKSDGTMLAWGYDGEGQLGDDATIADKATPVAVSGATEIVAVAAGRFHSLALKSDGTVLAWGLDALEENKNASTPVIVSGATNIVAIAAGGFHSLALKSDGTVLAWGSDEYGQLGDGGSSNDTVKFQATPVLVKNLTEVVAISAGGSHSLALKSNGTVYSWGQNGYGQLGSSLDFNRYEPIFATGRVFVAIAAGNGHSLALTSSGQVWSWGDDFYGQLGDDTTIAQKSAPVAVSGTTNVVAIAAGNTYSLALKSDGKMLTWGDDKYGQLGNDSAIANQPTPVTVSGATNIVGIAGGSHSLALKSDGKMLAWGNGGFGQLGNNNATTNQPTPVDVLLGTFTIGLP